MAVETQADRKKESAIKHIKSAISDLSEIVVDQCPGSSDFKDTYLTKLRENFHKLLEVRDNLET